MSINFNEIELGSLFRNDYRYALETIKYTFIENLDEIDPEIQINDYVRVELQKESVKVHAGRCVNFIPTSCFSAEIGFVAELFFSDDVYEILKENEDKLETKFIEEGEFVLSNIMSRISLLLAQITSTSGLQPLITPPTIEIYE